LSHALAKDPEVVKDLAARGVKWDPKKGVPLEQLDPKKSVSWVTRARAKVELEIEKVKAGCKVP